MKINRQFAPQIYRRVVPITQGNDGSLSIDGDGTPVEFAIEMISFDERHTFDHLAEAGPPSPGLRFPIAVAIPTSHPTARIAPPATRMKELPHCTCATQSAATEPA